MRAALLVLTALGCGLAGQVKELVVLQRQLASEYHTNAISVNINNAVHLTVTFANSPMGQLPEDEREGAARGVATFVLRHYPHPDTLRTITVAFSSRTRAGPLTITRGGTAYRFAPAELRAAVHAVEKAAADSSAGRR